MRRIVLARLDRPQFRLARPSDAKGVASLHTDSWRRHYRGAYSDAFLDGDVAADRLTVWADRLRKPDPRHRTILAEDSDGLVGFAHTVLDDDPTWGALLDNLHVVSGQKRRGIGSRLLALTAQAVTEQAKGPGLYLWVLEQNIDAQAFRLQERIRSGGATARLSHKTRPAGHSMPGPVSA